MNSMKSGRQSVRRRRDLVLPQVIEERARNEKGSRLSVPLVEEEER